VREIVLKSIGNSVESALNGTREDAERNDHTDRDDCQDDAVLRHRLTFLAREADAEVLDQIRNQQDGFTPSPQFKCASTRKEFAIFTS
jgi:hypothetical protein